MEESSIVTSDQDGESERSEVTELKGGGEVQQPDTKVGAVIRGVLSRFLPANLAMMAVITLGFGPADALSPLNWVIVGSGLTLGFGAGLFGLRKWLDPKSDIAGRRSLIAGLFANPALGLVSLAYWTTDPVALSLLSLGTGVGVALVTYFPWLSKPDPAEEGPGRIQADGE